ncbi:MAG: hypothetical protein ABL982_24645, partial [Vicinamibacterales bacterium]
MSIVISNLELPEALRADLASRRPLSAEQKARLGALLGAVEPFPDLYDLAGMRAANQLWSSEQVGFYLGNASAVHSPGNVDPRLAVIIGQAEPDGPIALDYRVSPPRVIYLGGDGNQSYWIELSESYDALIAVLSSCEGLPMAVPTDVPSSAAMTVDALVNQLADSRDLAAIELMADLSAGELHAMPCNPGREGARSLS